ncbi:MAG TPA: DUF4131 domain-containing protein [Alphaproteobacteria bacterium]|nr:DUF4131 domain-containing protein [Alphaproteobacteria bacterium]
MAEFTIDLAAGPPGRTARLAARLGEAFFAERERWSLWLPVFGGVGVLAYFALGREPPVWLGAATSVASLILLAAMRRRAGLALILVAVLASAIGFTLAQIRTSGLRAPMLVREIGPVYVEGRVISQDMLPTGVRVVLNRPILEDLAPEDSPRRVRVRLTRYDPPPATGARVRVLAVLNGPSPPVMPGPYDFRRHAYFQGIGGIGYAVGRAETVSAAEPGGLDLKLEGLRPGRR